MFYTWCGAHPKIMVYELGRHFAVMAVSELLAGAFA